MNSGDSRIAKPIQDREMIGATNPILFGTSAFLIWLTSDMSAVYYIRVYRVSTRVIHITGRLGGHLRMQIGIVEIEIRVRDKRRAS